MAEKTVALVHDDTETDEQTERQFNEWTNHELLVYLCEGMQEFRTMFGEMAATAATNPMLKLLGGRFFGAH